MRWRAEAAFRRTVVAVSLVVMSLVAAGCSYETPDFTFRLGDLATAQSSRVYDRNGVLITELRGEQGRTDVTDLNQIPEIVRNAVIAIEDERFYEHEGVDLKAILRAARSNLSAGGISQGGSTITQQYVGNVFLDRSDQSVARKIVEYFMARRFEQYFTKDFILLRYLNWVYFGNGAYGIEAAAREYFGSPACELAATGTSSAVSTSAVSPAAGLSPAVSPSAMSLSTGSSSAGLSSAVSPSTGSSAGLSSAVLLGQGSSSDAACLKVSELRLEQAALLAGLIQRPSAFDPYRNPDDARRRRDLVLERMLANEMITADEYETALRQPLVLVEDVPILDTEYPAAHFVEDVKQWFLDNPLFGPTREHRTRLLFEGGLEIHTTIDLELQADAEASVEAILPDNGVNPNAAAVTLGVGGDEDGQVLAMVGGRDFFGSDPDAKFNLASGKGRQAGSAMKPVALATALTSGFSVSSSYDAPDELDIDRPDVCGPVWKVRGGRGSTSEEPVSVNLVTATRSSVNTVYAQLMVDIRPANFVTMAESLGVEPGSVTPVCAAVLGTEDVNMVEMATVFSTLARSGRRLDPVMVTEILQSDGALLYRDSSEPVFALNPSTADQITWVLEGTITSGTGRNAAIDRPAAGKTGTAQNYADATFVGYTPQRATAVWVGYADAQIPMVPPTTDIRVTGGSYPAMIWREIMLAAHKDVPRADFPPPPWSVPPTTTEPPPPDSVEIPDLIGRKWSELVAAEIEALTLFVATVEVETAEFAAGTIIGQAPTAGSLAPGETTVNVEVAVEPELPELIEVPSVVGLTEGEARQVVAAARLGLEVIVEPRLVDGIPSGEPGTVWQQEPLASTSLEVGRTMTVWVSPIDDVVDDGDDIVDDNVVDGIIDDNVIDNDVVDDIVDPDRVTDEDTDRNPDG